MKGKVRGKENEAKMKKGRTKGKSEESRESRGGGRRKNKENMKGNEKEKARRRKGRERT